MCSYPAFPTWYGDMQPPEIVRIQIQRYRHPAWCIPKPPEILIGPNCQRLILGAAVGDSRRGVQIVMAWCLSCTSHKPSGKNVSPRFCHCYLPPHLLARHQFATVTRPPNRFIKHSISTVEFTAYLIGCFTASPIRKYWRYLHLILCRSTICVNYGLTASPPAVI